MIKSINILYVAVAVICLSSFTFTDGFKGKWAYAGGVYNGKAEPAPQGYKLQRSYKKDSYEAVFIEQGQKPFIYESGNYNTIADTCFETQTFSANPSKVLNITVKYNYTLKNDTLTFNGVLPNGTQVHEYWIKEK